MFRPLGIFVSGRVALAPRPWVYTACRPRVVQAVVPITRFRLYSQVPPPTSGTPPQPPMRDSNDTASKKPLNLPESLERWREPLAQAQHLAHELRHNPHAILSRLGARINEYTGYRAIEKLKTDVLHAEQAFVEARAELESSKTRYEETIAARGDGQRELNALLQRKNTWSDEDLTRFTAIYRAEHANEAAEVTARAAHRTAETHVEQSYTRLVDAIRARYHEEQVWSDRIRAASTYGTWGLMGIHVLLFLIVQTIVEPRKRQKLAERIEDTLHQERKEDEVILSNRIAALEATLSVQQDMIARVEGGVQEIAHASGITTDWVKAQREALLVPVPYPEMVEGVEVMPMEEEDDLPTIHPLQAEIAPINPITPIDPSPKWMHKVSPWQLSAGSALAGGFTTLCLSLLFR